MAVHAYEEKIKVSVAAFEVRYEEGYRYLDRSGEALVRIRRHDRSWVVVGMNPQSGQLMNSDKNLVLFFNTDRCNLGVNAELDLNGAEGKIERFAKESRAIYEIVTDSIGVTETTRIGIRFRFLAPADNMEEADRFVGRGSRSPLLEEIEKSTRSRLHDAFVAYIVEDAEKGHRMRVEVSSQFKQKAGTPAYTGLGGEEGTGSACVDIDTFTRPESGHFERSDLFIQNNYLRSRTVALELYRWLRQKQK